MKLLTRRHDSASVRKAHNLGRNHVQLVREYYQKIGYDKTQSVIDALAQDYQSQIVQQDPNPFASMTFGGTSSSPQYNNRVVRPGPGGVLGGPAPNGVPIPGMPLPPPPGMPLPGGGFAGAPPPSATNPFAQFQQPMGQLPPAMPPNTGGRVE